MKIHLSRALLFFALLTALTLPAFAEAPVNYAGTYELAAKKSDRDFSLEVLQTGSRVDVAFSAAMADGTGAAPDAKGRGHVEDGVLSFKFKDSFNNEGTCTLQPGKGGYHLMITVTKIVEPKPLHFYGEVLLRKITDKSSKP